MALIVAVLIALIVASSGQRGQPLNIRQYMSDFEAAERAAEATETASTTSAPKVVVTSTTVQTTMPPETEPSTMKADIDPEYSEEKIASEPVPVVVESVATSDVELSTTTEPKVTTATEMSKAQMDRELLEKKKAIVLRADRIKWTEKRTRYMKLPIRPPKLRPLSPGTPDAKYVRRAMAKKMMLAYGLRAASTPPSVTSESPKKENITDDSTVSENWISRN